MLVLDPSGRQNYIDSPDADARLGLQHPRALGATQDEPPITAVSPAEAAERLDAIIQSVEAGGHRELTEATEKGTTTDSEIAGRMKPFGPQHFDEWMERLWSPRHWSYGLCLDL